VPLARDRWEGDEVADIAASAREQSMTYVVTRIYCEAAEDHDEDGDDEESAKQGPELASEVVEEPPALYSLREGLS
jgi:hypothetical protein